MRIGDTFVIRQIRPRRQRARREVLNAVEVLRTADEGSNAHVVRPAGCRATDAVLRDLEGEVARILELAGVDRLGVAAKIANRIASHRVPSVGVARTIRQGQRQNCREANERALHGAPPFRKVVRPG